MRLLWGRFLAYYVSTIVDAVVKGQTRHELKCVIHIQGVCVKQCAEMSMKRTEQWWEGWGGLGLCPHHDDNPDDAIIAC